MKTQVYLNRRFEYARLFELGLIVTLTSLILILQGNKKFVLTQQIFEQGPGPIDVTEIPIITVEKKLVPPRPPSIPIPSEDVIEIKGYDPSDFFINEGWDPEEIPLPKEPIEKEMDFIVIYEKPPLPIGGMKAIRDHLIYPELARMAGIEGRVTVLAYIDETGKVVKTEIVQSLGPNGCDEAAMRAVSAVRWEPAMQRDRPVRVKISIPIDFKLSKS